MKETEDRAYQNIIINKAYDAFTIGNSKSVMIVSPAGSGKTIMGLKIAKKLMENSRRIFNKDSIKIGWMAMRRNLLAQTKKENEETKDLQVPNIEYISMFDKNPPKVDILVEDECLPYGSLVEVIENGIAKTVKIGDVIIKNIGDKILSHNIITNELEYQPIINRMFMGIKQIYEIDIETPTGIITLEITKNGKIWTNKGYVKVDQLEVNQLVFCCQTYLQNDAINSTLCTQKSLVQIRKIHPQVDIGRIIAIRKTQRFIETYDVEVKNNHNLYANGILVHNSHHTAANSAVYIENKTKPLLRCSLSATPWRSDNMKLCFSTIITEAGYHRLIADGYLAKFNQFMMPEWNVKTVTGVFLSDPKRWGKTIMFFLTIKEAYEAANILRRRGITVDTITGQTNRMEQLDRFKNNEMQVITNVYVLTEGFNMPDIRTVFVRDSQKGPTIQMAGRVLRLHPDIPVVNIIQSKNTKWPFVKTASPYSQFIYENGLWRSIGSNEMVDIMYKEMTQRVINVELEMPTFITNKRKKNKIQ